jgi:hypothetical protein
MEAHALEQCKGLMDGCEHWRRQWGVFIAQPLLSLPQHRYLNLINFLVIPMIADAGIVRPLRTDPQAQAKSLTREPFFFLLCSGACAEPPAIVRVLKGP